MEFTNDEKKYVFNCISEHTNGTRDTFDKAREYLVVAPFEFKRLKCELFRMIEDMEVGTDLLIRLHDDIERDKDCQSARDCLQENRFLIQALKYSFLRAKAAVDKDEDE
jgi:hypothetical protein